MKFYRCYRTLLLFLFMYCCASCSDSRNADISDIKISYQSYPFYKDFHALDTNNFGSSLLELQKKYPDFLDFFLDTLAGFGLQGNYNEPSLLLHGFFSHKDYRHLQDTVVKAFPDTKEIDDHLQLSFRYSLRYDSSISIPQHVYYFVSGLNGFTAVYQNQRNIGIGLDMFLGADFMPYTSVGIPAYATIRQTAENIPVWVMKMLYEDRYPFEYEEKTLLEMMISKGKELYYLEKVTPYLPDHIRLGYTPEQMKWCEENEALIYNFLVQNKYLHDRNLQKIMRYVSDGPTSTGMPPESPGNIGSFIGMKIVRRFMAEKKPGMQELLQMQDAQQILEAAAYKP